MWMEARYKTNDYTLFFGPQRFVCEKALQPRLIFICIGTVSIVLWGHEWTVPDSSIGRKCGIFKIDYMYFAILDWSKCSVISYAGERLLALGLKELRKWNLTLIRFGYLVNLFILKHQYHFHKWNACISWITEGSDITLEVHLQFTLYSWRCQC